MAIPENIVPGNGLPKQPKWGIHRSAIVSADTVLPEDYGAGVNTDGWESIWVDIHFKNVGTKTATIRPVFWNPGATPDGASSYDGAFFEQDAITDITIDGADAGHKSIEIQTKGRIVFFKVQALGSGAEVHVFVSGAVSAR